MPDLRDYLLVRQNELTRKLAGYACCEPAFVLDLIHKMKTDDLTDECARKFLTALTPEANPCVVALQLGLAKEYLLWLALGCESFNLRQMAREACNEIKILCITREGISTTENWIAETRKIGRYGCD